jgi:hypothetical protein
MLDLHHFTLIWNKASYLGFIKKDTFDLYLLSYLTIDDILDGCMSTRVITSVPDCGYSKPSYPTIRKFVKENPLVSIAGLSYKTTHHYQAQYIKLVPI